MDLEQLVVAAEEALAAADQAIAAVAVASDEGASEEVVARAATIRKRAEDAAAALEAEKKPDEEAARAKRAEEETAANATAEDTKKEEAEVERLRSVAKTFGHSRTFDGLKAINSRSAVIREAIELAMIADAKAARSMPAVSPIIPSERSAAPAIDHDEIYALINR